MFVCVVNFVEYFPVIVRKKPSKYLWNHTFIVFSSTIVHLSWKESAFVIYDWIKHCTVCSCPPFCCDTCTSHVFLKSHFPVTVHYSNLLINTNKSKSTWECSLVLLCQWILIAAAGVQRKQQTCCLDQNEALLIVPPLRIWYISSLITWLSLVSRRKYAECQIDDDDSEAPSFVNHTMHTWCKGNSLQTKQMFGDFISSSLQGVLIDFISTVAKNYYCDLLIWLVLSITVDQVTKNMGFLLLLFSH